MRYYNLLVSGAPANVFPARYENGAQWGTIAPNGVHDPNAQQIEFQLVLLDATTPTENSTLTIYGVSWDQIVASNQLVGKVLTFNGGMSPGLPLADFQSKRDKFIMEANILKCWGNWIGNETSIGMLLAPTGLSSAPDSSAVGEAAAATGPSSGDSGSSPAPQIMRYNRGGGRSLDRRRLPIGRPSAGITGFDVSSIAQQVGGQIISDFNIGPATSQVGGMISSFFGGGNFSPLSAPINMIHNLMPNMPLSGAIQETLSKAFPNANLNVAISSALKLAYQDAGIYQSLEQYAGYINNLSQSIMGIMGGKYPGIHISSNSRLVDVWDRSSSLGNFDIDYKDLIGQPTWLDFNTVSIKVVLRGGLRVGVDITLPQTLINYNGADSMLPGQAPYQRSHVTLPGAYQIQKIMHIGDFRNPDGASWSTNIEAAYLGSVNGAEQLEQQLNPQPQRDPGAVSIKIRPTS